MLRNLFLGMVVASLATAAGAVTVSTAPGAPDPGPLAGETWLIDYNAGLPAGVTATGSYKLVTGTVPSDHAAPAGDATQYFSVPDATSSGSADLWIGSWLPAPVKSFSLYWGSVDAYNTLDLLDAGGNVFYSISGASLPPANGNQADSNSNIRVYFTLGAGETLGGLRFTSNGYAFEHDDLAFAVVPEPATWAMLIAGFGMVGFTARRRQRAVTC